MLLFLNDIAASEVLVILIFILIFFGPKSIPGIARSLGKTMRQIKDATAEVQEEIRKSGVDIKKDMNLTGLISQTQEDIRQPLDQYVSDLDDAISYSPPKPQPITSQIPAENNVVEDISSEVQNTNNSEETKQENTEQKQTEK